MKAKKKNTKHGELWIKIRDFIKLIIKNSDDYDEKCMKIKFNSNEELPLNTTIKIPTMTIVVRVVFYENKNIIHKFFLDKCLYKIQTLKIKTN